MANHMKPIVEEPEPEPTDAVEYFWRVVEASNVEDLKRLWADFEPRAAELRAMAKVEDVSDSLWHLGRALDQSELLSRGKLQAKRAAILNAIAAATSSPPP
jgi:hypothetical protein